MNLASETRRTAGPAGTRVVITALLAVVLLAAALALVACGGEVSPSPTPTGTAAAVYTDVSAAAVPKAASSSQDRGAALKAPLWQLGFDLLERQATKAGGQNVVVSPVSLAAALAMTLQGARGATAEQMRAALRLDDLSADEVNGAWADLIAASNAMEDGQARLANSLWLRDGIDFVPEFLKLNDDYYAATTRGLPGDLSLAPKQINDWISESTGGRIPQLISKVPENTVLVLVNTLFVKVRWEHFAEEASKDDAFTLADGSKIKVPTMHSTLESEAVETPGYVALRLPTESTPNLWIVVPKGKETPATVLRKLRREGAQGLRANEDVEVELSLPRFKVEYESDDLPDDLRAMGMSDAFDASRAQFQGMATVPPETPIYIGDVLQKAMIDVNEEGVEGAAATAVMMDAYALPPQQRRHLTLRVDRPFLAVLTGIDGAPLFMTLVNDPR